MSIWIVAHSAICCFRGWLPPSILRSCVCVDNFYESFVLLGFFRVCRMHTTWLHSFLWLSVNAVRSLNRNQHANRERRDRKGGTSHCINHFAALPRSNQNRTVFQLRMCILYHIIWWSARWHLPHTQTPWRVVCQHFRLDITRARLAGQMQVACTFAFRAFGARFQVCKIRLIFGVYKRFGISMYSHFFPTYSLSRSGMDH